MREKISANGERLRRDGASASSGPFDQLLGPERLSSTRLPAFDYVGPHAYFITIGTVGRHLAFADADRVQLARSALDEASRSHGFAALAYCFMPDHLHLLLQGSDSSDLIAFMKRFKQLSSYRYKQRTGRQLWQRSYFEHVLRHDDNRDGIAAYIWENPVQAGLVAEREIYPFSGPRSTMGPDRPKGLSLRSPRPAGASRG